MIKLVQFVMMAATGCGLIWFGKHELHSDIPPASLGVIVIGVPLALTWLIVKGIDLRRYGPAAVFPPVGTVLKVSGLVVLVTAGWLAALTLAVWLDP